MTPEMAFERLLVSHDPRLCCTMTEVFHNFSIVVETCLTASKACEIVTERNPELVAIDCDGDPSASLLEAIWTSPHRRKPTILGLSGDTRPIPGAHFVLRKPVSKQSATESFVNLDLDIFWTSPRCGNGRRFPPNPPHRRVAAPHARDCTTKLNSTCIPTRVARWIIQRAFLFSCRSTAHS